MGYNAGMASSHAVVKEKQVAVERDAGNRIRREPAAANLGIVQRSASRELADLPRRVCVP
jgi:hypothetical protein